MNIPDTDAAREVLERARDLWAHIEGPRDYVDYPDLPSISSELGAELVGMRSALDAFLDSFGAGEADRSVLTAHAEAISQAETAWRLMRDVRQGGEADPSEAIAAAEASVDALSETGAAVQSIEGGIQTAAIVSAILAIRARVNEELERGSQGFFSDWFSYYNEFRLLEKTLETLETVVRPDPSDVTVEPTEARWTGFRDQAHEDPSLGYVERWVIPWNGTVATPLLDQELVPEQNFDNGPAAVGVSFYKEFDGDGNEVYSGEAAAWQRYENRTEARIDNVLDDAAAQILDAFSIDLLYVIPSGFLSYAEGDYIDTSDASWDPDDYWASPYGNIILIDGPEATRLEGDAGNDRLFGGGGNDRLEGGRGDDVLDGGPGADRMSGGRGDDLYIVDSLGDAVNERRDEGGFDVVRTFVDFAIGAQDIEHLVGEGADGLILTGRHGRERITGTAGDDTISGAGGRDTLTGGFGEDSFVLDHGPTRVLITDWEAGDRLVFEDRLLGFGGETDDLRNITGGRSREMQEAGLAAWNAETGVLSLDRDGQGLAPLVRLGPDADLSLADIWLF